jgi:hypothetical protein
VESRRTRRLGVLLGLAVLAAAASLAGSAATAAPETTGSGQAGAKNPAVSRSGVRPADIGGYTIVTAASSVPANGYTNAVAQCPAGTVVLGGGEGNASQGNVVLTDSRPLNDVSWLAWVRNAEANPVNFWVYAICGS